MQCPTCNHLNDAMSVRCLRCQSVLIHEAVGHSAEFRRAVRLLDAEVYSRLGAVFGFLGVAIALKLVFTLHDLSDTEIGSAAAFGAVAGAFAGKLLARSGHRF